MNNVTGNKKRKDRMNICIDSVLGVLYANPCGGFVDDITDILHGEVDVSEVTRMLGNNRIDVGDIVSSIIENSTRRGGTVNTWLINEVQRECVEHYRRQVCMFATLLYGVGRSDIASDKLAALRLVRATVEELNGKARDIVRERIRLALEVSYVLYCKLTAITDIRPVQRVAYEPEDCEALEELVGH